MLHASWTIDNPSSLYLKHKLPDLMRIDEVDSTSQNPTLVISGTTACNQLALGLRLEQDQQSNNNYEDSCRSTEPWAQKLHPKSSSSRFPITEGDALANPNRFGDCFHSPDR
jgi:hypothetical protein